MNVANYMHLVPEIERRMRFHRIDTVIMGLGPTAHLLPWLSRDLIAPARIFGCHDAWRIYSVEDLVIMDPPQARLSPGAVAHDYVVGARPKRLWIHEPNQVGWLPHLHGPMLKVIQPVPWFNWNKVQGGASPRPKASLSNDPPDTLLVSPTGMTTLAWREGRRRIGVIGVEMRVGDHHTAKYVKPVSRFFTDIAEEAAAAGGCIINLSPITALEGFEQWTIRSESSSAAIPGSPAPEPSESSNTASASTQAAQ